MVEVDPYQLLTDPYGGDLSSVSVDLIGTVPLTDVSTAAGTECEKAVAPDDALIWFSDAPGTEVVDLDGGAPVVIAQVGIPTDVVTPADALAGFVSEVDAAACAAWATDVVAQESEALDDVAADAVLWITARIESCDALAGAPSTYHTPQPQTSSTQVCAQCRPITPTPTQHPPPAPQRSVGGPPFRTTSKAKSQVSKPPSSKSSASKPAIAMPSSAPGKLAAAAPPPAPASSGGAEDLENTAAMSLGELDLGAMGLTLEEAREMGLLIPGVTGPGTLGSPTEPGGLEDDAVAFVSEAKVPETVEDDVLSSDDGMGDGTEDPTWFDLPADVDISAEADAVYNALLIDGAEAFDEGMGGLREACPLLERYIIGHPESFVTASRKRKGKGVGKRFFTPGKSEDVMADKVLTGCWVCSKLDHGCWECPFKRCFTCSHQGHTFEECQAHRLWCNACSKKGHDQDSCPLYEYNDGMTAEHDVFFCRCVTCHTEGHVQCAIAPQEERRLAPSAMHGGRMLPIVKLGQGAPGRIVGNGACGGPKAPTMPPPSFMKGNGNGQSLPIHRAKWSPQGSIAVGMRPVIGSKGGALNGNGFQSQRRVTMEDAEDESMHPAKRARFQEDEDDVDGTSVPAYSSTQGVLAPRRHLPGGKSRPPPLYVPGKGSQRPGHSGFGVSSSTCPRRHPLRQRVDDNQYQCDDCQLMIYPGDHFFDCGRCNFSLCGGCEQQAGAELGAMEAGRGEPESLPPWKLSTAVPTQRQIVTTKAAVPTQRRIVIPARGPVVGKGNFAQHGRGHSGSQWGNHGRAPNGQWTEGGFQSVAQRTNGGSAYLGADGTNRRETC